MSYTVLAQPRLRRPRGAQRFLAFLSLAGVAALMGAPQVALGQTTNLFTGPGGNFTEIVGWNFEAGGTTTTPIPVPSVTQSLFFQTFGTQSYTATDDLDFTLQTLSLNAFSNSTLTINNALVGTLAFTGATAVINQNGTGGTSTISAPVVLGSTIGANGLQILGAGQSNTTISGAISSSSSTGGPLKIGLTTGVANAGIVTLSSGANTFAGGVVLNSGALAITGANAPGIFGNTINTLTINGGTLSGSTTIINPVIANSNVVYTGGANSGTLTIGGLLGNGISGAGGLVVQPPSGAALNLGGINTYTGPTTVGMIQYATTSSPSNPGTLRLLGPLAQITATSAINIKDGSVLEIGIGSGNSVNNNHVPSTAPVNITNGYIQLINNTAATAGVVDLNLGTVTVTGLGTIVPFAGQANAGSQITINNLVRNTTAGLTGGTFLFTGQTLGTQAVAPGVQEGNVILNSLNGSSTATAAGLTTGGFIGGGFYSSVTGGLLTSPATNLSILPYALGDTQNAGNVVNAGSSFVTYGASNGNFGLRPLAATEYNTGNFATAPALTDNMKIGGSAALASPTTVNSVYFGTTGTTISGSSLQITSGALASNVATATIDATVPSLSFGNAGTGEAVVSVVSPLATGTVAANVMTINAPIAATTLTKAGYGVLVLGSTTNSFSSGLITVDAGAIQIGAVANLGNASQLTFDMNDYGGAVTLGIPGGLIYTGTGTESLTQNITINSGRANLRLTGAGNLTVAGNISGNGGLNIDPTGPGSVVTLTGTNTQTGGTRFNNGGGAIASTVIISGDGNLGAAGAPLGFNASGMTLKLAGAWTTTRPISIESNFGSATGTASGAGALTTAEGFDTAGFNSTWNGQLIGGSTLFKIDSSTTTAGVWQITSANNPFTGTINLGTALHQGGTLQLTTGDINSGAVTFGASGGPAGTYVLDLSSAANSGVPWRSFSAINTASGFTQSHLIQLSLVAGPFNPVDVRVGGGTFGGTAGVIQGNGSLIVTSGTFTLTSAVGNGAVGSGIGNSYMNQNTNNSVEVWGGTLIASTDAQLGDPSGAIALKGGTFENSNPTGVTTFTSARNFILSPSTQTLVGNGPPINFNNVGTQFPASGVLQQTLQITGTVTGGGYEKTGFGTLYLSDSTGGNTVGGDATNGNNRPPYTGYIKLNQGNIEFNNDSNLGSLSTTGGIITGTGVGSGMRIVLLSLGGDNVGGTLELAPGNTATIARFIAIQAANTQRVAFQVDAGSALTYNGSLVGASTTEQMTYFGATNSSFSFGADASRYIGTLSIGDNASHNVQGVLTTAVGNAFLTASAQLPRAIVTIAANSAATLDMSGLSKSIGGFNNNTGTTLALGTGGQLTFGWNNNNSSIAGAITGDATASINQVGTGTTTITSNTSTFGGGYNVLFTGGLTLSGATGTLPAETELTVGAWGSGVAARGPVLSLDSTVSHLAATQVVNLNSSELSVIGSATPVAQAMATLNGSGYSIVTAGTGSAGAEVDFSTGLTRVNNGTFLFRSGSTGTLGFAATGATQSNITFANLTAANLIGGGGAAGTAQISILPYAVGDDSASGLGSTFVTYGANGIRTLQNAAGEYNPTLIGAGPTDNVRVSNASFTPLTLNGSNQTVNSLILTGTANSSGIYSTTNETLTVTSGAILNTVNNVYTLTVTANGVAAQPLGIQTARLLTGNGNTQQLNVFTTGGDLAIGSLVSTSGGLVKSGVGSLYLTNSANTYTGGTTVNGGNLVVSSLSAIDDGAANTLTLSGGFFKYTGPSASVASSVVLGGGSGSNPGMTGGVSVASGATLSLPSGISGAGGILKDGTGVLALSGTNTFNGPVIIQAGAVSIDGSAALGNNSRILFGPDSGGSPGASLQFLNPTTLTQEIDIISSNAAIGAGFDTNGNAVTISGVINSPPNNSKGIYKLGAGNLTLTGANLYTGSTQVFGGTLTFAGANGSALNSGMVGTGSAFSATDTFVANFGANLVLDNTIAVNNNRLPTPFNGVNSGGNSAGGGGIRLQGGNFTIIGNSTTITSEQTNEIDIFAGTISLNVNLKNVTLTSGHVSRTNSDSIAIIQGRGLGSQSSTIAAPLNNTTNWYSIDLSGGGSTQLGGIGGAKATPYIGIVPGFAVDASVGSTGAADDLATYDSGTGFRPLAATEYKATFDGTIVSPNYDDSRAPNISLSASTAAPSFSTWVAGMKLSGSTALTGTAGLIVRQSTILATGNGTPSISVPVLGSFGNGGYDFLVTGTTNLTVNSALNGSQLFMYGGSGGNGQLTLTNAYYGAGQVFVGAGSTLNLSGASAFLNPVNSNVNVAVGGALNLGGIDRRIASINTQSLIGTFNLGQVSDGTINLVSNNLTLYDNVNSTFTGQITGAAGSTLTQAFNSASTVTLTQPQPSFNGTVRVNNGTFQLASSGTLPNASLIDIRGGTLAFNNSDDNGAAGGYVAQRTSVATPINLAGGITFTGNPNAIASHQLGTVNLVGGGTVTVNPGSTAPTTVTIANLTRAANHGTLIVSGPVAGGAAVTVSGFGGLGTGWTANNNASFTASNVLQLTPNIGSAAGSAWFNTPVPASRPFVMSFTYTVTAAGSPPADGITFGFQNAGLNALGAGGGSLGWGGAAFGAGFVAVTPSAAGQINIYPPNTSGGVGSGTGVITNAQTVPSGVPASTPVNAGLVNTPDNVVVTYNGATMTIAETQGTSTHTASYALNIGGAVGSTAFIGFTGGTGGATAAQQISNFTFTSPPAVTGTGVAQSPIGGAIVQATQIEGGSPMAALVGGGGANGTTTISIIPWAWSNAGGFVTYDPSYGVRPLNTGSGVGSEYLNAFPAAPSFDNVLLGAGAQTLTAGNTEMNSLIQPNASNITGAAGAASTLTVRSGALAFTSASTVAPGAGGTLNLNTGVTGVNSNVPELVVFNSAAVTLNAVISTTGGVTKFGGSTLTLAGVNTFTGGLAINGGTVAYNNDNQLGNVSNSITFGLPTNNASPNGIGLQYVNPGATPVPAVITRNFVTNSFGGIIGPAAQVTTLNNVISGTGVFAYNATSSSSIYEVNGNNTYTGDTYLNFGDVSVGGATPDAAFGANPNSAIIVNSGIGTDGFILRSNWTTSHTIQMRSAGGIDPGPAFVGVNGSASTGALTTMTVNSPIIGTAGITKNNEGTLVLTVPNSTTGVITVNSGSLVLTGQGALVASPSLGFGTQLILDDNGQGAGGAASHYSDRLAENSATITGNNTEIKLIGNDTVTTEQVMGSLTLGAASKLTVVSNGQPTILRLGQGAVLTRSTGSSILFRGTNLGTAAPGTAGVANIMVFNPAASAAALTGGGGPAGNTAISIIAGAFGDTNANGNGQQLVTYDFTNGIRLLNPATEYATVAQYVAQFPNVPGGVNGTNTTDNLHLTSSLTSIANATTVNALWLDGTGGPITVSGGGTLTVTAGNILAYGTGANGSTINTPIAGGTAANAIAIGGPGDVNITAVIPASNTGGLIKSGDGNLTLSAANLYTGTTYLSTGTLTINNNAAIPASQAFRILGGTLAAGPGGLTLAAGNAVALDGDLTFGGSNDFTIAGTVSLDSGARVLNIAAGRTLTLSGTLQASSNSLANDGITVNGGGRLVMSGNNTYGGVAATSGFYLTQTIVNAGELRVNGQTGANSGTGGSTVVVNNAGTVLSGNGQIIPAQQLEARNTVYINSGAVLSPGLNTPNVNGTLTPGALTVGSSTTPGTTTAQVNQTAGSYYRFLYTSNPVPAPAAADSGLSETAGSATGNNDLVVNGSLVLAAGANFSIFGNENDFTPGQTYSFLVGTATSIPQSYSIDSVDNPGQFDTSNFANFVPGEFYMQVHTVGNNEYFNLTTPVPEPSTLLMVGAGALGLAGAYRRRRRAAAAQ